MAEKEYHRLTRARRRSGFSVASTVRSSLWRGADHLLCIDTTGYTETYKRFYFQDIQAIIVCKTDRGKHWNLALGVLMGLFALFAVISKDITTISVLGVISGLFLLALLLNVLAGPTSISQLRTAVQTEELASLNRLRRARKVRDILRPFIAQAQGQLAPEDIPAHRRHLTGAGLATQANASASTADDPNVPPRIAS
jgi:hypothetical protein